MASTITSRQLEQLRTLYDDSEIAILYDWLEWQRPAPLQGLHLPVHDDDDTGEGGPVRLLRSAGGYSDQNALSNAVARLVLTGIQHRLPQWAVVQAGGRVQYARTRRPTRKAQVEVLPQHLFTINWADSGPGFSWPEAYHVTFLPAFECYVVTASQDSPDVHGYTEEAIGHFDREADRKSSIERIIRDWWCWQADTGQPRWAYLFNVGEINAETAEKWCDVVWPEFETEDCEEQL